MTQVSIEWTIVELEDLDIKGRRLCRVTETDHREAEDRSYTVPCVVAEALVRARRSYIARTMKDDGAFRVEDHFDIPKEMKE